MKFRPLHDRVVLTRIDADDKTAGGIIIPDTAKEKPSEGEVISVGPGGRDEAGKIIPIDLNPPVKGIPPCRNLSPAKSELRAGSLSSALWPRCAAMR